MRRQNGRVNTHIDALRRLCFAIRTLVRMPRSSWVPAQIASYDRVGAPARANTPRIAAR